MAYKVEFSLSREKPKEERTYWEEQTTIEVVGDDPTMLMELMIKHLQIEAGQSVVTTTA